MQTAAYAAATPHAQLQAPKPKDKVPGAQSFTSPVSPPSLTLDKEKRRRSKQKEVRGWAERSNLQVGASRSHRLAAQICPCFSLHSISFALSQAASFNRGDFPQIHETLGAVSVEVPSDRVAALFVRD